MAAHTDPSSISTLTGAAAILASLAGSGLLGWAAWRSFHREVPGAVPPTKPLNMVMALRAALVGGALVALGAGLWLDNSLLIGLALIIGLEELLETSVVVMALRDERARQESERETAETA